MKYNLKELYTDSDKYSDLLDKQGYTIYKITNEVNNKCYIGDSSETLRYRFFTAWHGSHFSKYESKFNHHLYNSMNKHGLENFTLEILPYSDELTEEYYIQKFDSFNKGFNRNYSGKAFNGIGPIKDRVTLNNGSELKYVKSSEVEYWKSNGWKLGFGELAVNSEAASIKRTNTMIDKYGSETAHMSTKESLVKRNKSREWHVNHCIENKDGIYSVDSVKKAEASRKSKGKSLSDPSFVKSIHATRMNIGGKMVIDYLKDNNLEVNEANFNASRKLINRNMSSIPKWDKFKSSIDKNI